MKKVIRLTESDLTRIVKRVMNENDKQNFFRRRLYKYDGLLNWKMNESLKRFCLYQGGKGNSKSELKKRYVENLKEYIFEVIERDDFRNISFSPYYDDYSEDTKKFEKIFNQIYLDKINNYFDENCTAKNNPTYFMKYFEKIINKIQQLFLEAMEGKVDIDRVPNEAFYLREVLNYVWLNLDKDKNTPSEENFIDFMYKKDFVKQILNHYKNLME